MVQLDKAAWHAMNYPNMVGIGIEMVDNLELPVQYLVVVAWKIDLGLQNRS